MPEIKHQFTGGKMNKDVDERLVPNGEYRDAMNIQVSTSEGSDVGTIQNILGNTNGCINNTGNYIQDGSHVVGSVADEKNDSLYWLVSGPIDVGGQQLAVNETVSLKDLIVRLDVSSQLCDPIFVDSYSFCVGISASSNLTNSIVIDSSLYAQVTAGMTATGYGNNINLFGPTPVIGIGNITTLAVNYYNNFNFTGTPFTPPQIVISDADNTTMHIRGFWNDTTQDYTNIHYDSTVDTTGAPISQANLPPEGSSQFWIPVSDLPAQHNITIGSTIQNIGAQAYHALNGNANVLNGFPSITVNNIFLGQVIHPFNFQPIQAWIITVGDILGPDGFPNRVNSCWSDSLGATFGCNNYNSGIWQKAALIATGTQLRDAFPFYELEATIVPITTTAYTSVTNNNINVAAASVGWLDEIYNSLYDASGTLIAGVQLQVDNNIGSGYNFPPNSCIDPASVIDAANLDIVAGIYDSEFAIIDCDTGLGLAPGVIIPDTTGKPVTFNIIGNDIEGIILNEIVNMNGVDTVCFESERALNFEHDKLITGIDIIDDVLLWTDNFTEPKKINITRSAQGTDMGGEIHTAIVNQGAGYDLTNDYNPIREEHITVIRKAPKNALNLELSNGRDPSLSYAGRTQVGTSSNITSIINSSNNAVSLDFSALAIGDTVSFFIEEDHLGANLNLDFAWEEGGYLLLKEFSNGIADNVPLVNWTIRGLITESPLNSFENTVASFVQVEIQVVGINGTPGSPDPSLPNDPLYYIVDLEDTQPVIFEDKFPRFSYRYKYEDGEYSTFAPWSEVAFLPSGFDYEPKKGWNTGMLNNVRSIKVKGFYSTTWGSPLGKDIVEVDILYKEDSSPNIYLVQTISPVDVLTSQNNKLPWYSNEYLIKSETIKGIIPSNQLLRPWDNVPKKALAQSISGNRVIYANYEQNYNLKSQGQSYRPDFSNSLINWAPPTSASPRKSIKSLRDYKLGVVFTDEHGRETPVLIGESGGFRVEKQNSINANRLKVKLKGQTPLEMTYYKFYVKETSNEYYNLAMDRWYKAEDGNLWLAFPSSDRNKMDLETSLYFKRGVEGDENVIENSTKYKVLAIENEAPEFIKTRRIRIGAVAHYEGSAEVFGDFSAAPHVKSASFTMDYEGGGFYGTSLSKIEDIKEDIYIQFVSSVDYSDQYKISEITSDFDVNNAPAATNPGNYHVTLDTAFKGDINFIFDNAASPTKIVDDIKIVFTKAVVENKPKFDGRFFAKIENDGKIQTQITDDAVGVNYIDVAHKTVYALEDDDKLRTVSQSALYESPDNASPALNYITLDYTADPLVPVDLARNPGGLNFNHLAARETYFFDATSWKSYSPSNANAPSGVFNHLQSYRSQGSNTLKDMGVWFIDRSTKKYEVIQGDNEFKWLDQNGMNDMFSPQCQDAAACGYTGVAGEIGNGITHDVANDNSFIELGFGGFGDPYAEADWKANIDCGDHQYTESSLDNFYGVGMGNTRWNDAATTKFVDGLSAGFSFRWKKDPTETIYKVEGQTSYQRNLRFGRLDEGLDCYLLSPNSGLLGTILADKIRQTKLLIGAPSSYTKTFGFKVTPSMDGWDPSAPVGTYSGQAGMMNGLKLGTGGILTTRSIAIAVSSGDVVITLDDVAPIQVGMSVGINANIPLLSKVTSVDLQNNKITIEPAATGGISVGQPFRSAFQIRVVEEHMFGLAGNTALPRENYIVVDNITTKCSNGNTLKPLYSLHEGMKLHVYNIDSSGDVAHDVIIKEIRPHVSGWKLTLAGYQNPMNTTYAAGNLSVDFVIGETLEFYQVSMNGASNFTEDNTDARQVNGPLSDNGVNPLGKIGAVGYDMVFMEPVDEYSDGGNLPENPFVWETEPKKNNDLDIYYEISENNPIELNTQTIKAAIPQDSTVVGVSGNGGTWNNVYVTSNSSASGQEIRVSEFFWVGPGLAPDGTTPVVVGDVLMITKPNGIQFSVKVAGWTPNLTTPTIAKNLILSPSLSNAEYNLNWHNCYSFGNGVESNRIKDTFNSPFISNGVKVSTTLSGGYKKERRKTGLIYSGIYNSTSGVNNLNQFIQAEKITKDVNPVYGSIQKLHSRSTADGDLIVLCEDRILKILANKDALYNADGNPQLIASNNVLGQAVPFSGNFGISKNPESFASESYRAYFTDRVRGAVVRLSKDGLTAISNYGMKDWFKDNLKLNSILTGSHDDKKSEYNITLKQVVDANHFPSGLTVSFKEDVKGWVSFKSFVPDNAISCANEYYTFKGATPWLHHVEEFDVLGKEIGRNTFYNIPKNSSFNVILNDAPGSAKSFNTINYEGSQSKVNQFLIDPTTGLSDGEYYNLHDKKGWYVDHIFTNKEVGAVSEFIEKEGKWFNYIKGKEIQLAGQYLLPGETLNPKPLSNFDLSSLSIQGLGRITSAPAPAPINGCTDPTQFNYDANANTDDGSCIPFTYGCTSPSASNYDPLANTNDGSCYWLGCTDPTAIGYNPSATVDDGSCIAVVLGCTDSAAFNYNALANVDDNSCIAVLDGCTDSTAFNYDPNANTDDGSCIAVVNGCTNALYTEYDSLANTDDGSCITLIVNGCTDSTALNYDPSATTDDGSCTYPVYGCTTGEAIYPQINSNYDPLATMDDGSCIACVYGCTLPASLDYDPAATCDLGSPCLTTYGCTDPTAGNYNPSADVDNGNCLYFGCTDPTAINYDATYNLDDGSCYYTNVNGCTNPSASNYDATANFDDGSCILEGCTDATATNYDATANFDDGSCLYPPLAIGDLHQGGIIYYLNGMGGGWIAALTNLANAEWGCHGTDIPGAQSTDGVQNTLDIIAGCNQTGIAARLADDYSVTDPTTGLTYSDWYLPSAGQASIMHNAIGLMATGGQVNTSGVSVLNIGNFTGNMLHWTSTEQTVYLARSVDPNTGVPVGLTKDIERPSRATRSF